MEHHPAKHHDTKKHQVNDGLSNDSSENDVKILLEWSAPSRLFRKRQKNYYLNLLLLMFALLVILFLFSQYLLMLVVLSFAFVSYAMASTPPADNHYRVSSEGVAIDDHYYIWQELYDFYFKKRGKDVTLHIRTKAYFPGELIMLFNEIPQDKIRNTLIRYLPYREIVKSSFSEKAGDWLYKTFPLDESGSA